MNIKKKLRDLIAPHLPAVINPDGHLPPAIKKFVLFILRSGYKKTFDGLYTVKIRFGPLKGKKMILNLDPENGAVNTEYLAGYRQEKEEINLTKKLVREGQTIWDIGIYRGFYCMMFSGLTGAKGKVMAFDLEERNCNVVNEVLRLNGIKNVTTYNYGISNQNIETDFISSPSSNSRLIGTFRGTNVDSMVLTKGETIKKVNLRTLNFLVEKFGQPDLIKMDIDGAELFALDTADKVFENNDLIFIIESHNPDTDTKITEYFTRNQCFAYSINLTRFFDNNEIFWGNIIGCKSKEKLQQLLNNNVTYN